MLIDYMDQKLRKVIVGMACLLHDVQSLSWDYSDSLGLLIWLAAGISGAGGFTSSLTCLEPAGRLQGWAQLGQ